jgi:hypothetical protein
MYIKEHIQRTKDLYGEQIANEYTWVHDWLDEMAQRGISLLKHRQYRHHEKALKEQFVPFIKANYPEAEIEVALNVAKLHITDDEGEIPKSELDYI